MSPVYISDTNIWINFQHAGLLADLFRLPFRFCCTDLVLAELSSTLRPRLLGFGLMIEPLAAEVVTRLWLFMQQYPNSALADASCYLLAMETGRPLLTGDGRLRKQAQRGGVQVHGVLWLFDQLLVHGVIAANAAAKGLELMLQNQARLPWHECNQRLGVWKSATCPA